jgi:hypothetical protein
MNARPSLRLCLAVASATLLVQPVLSPAQTAAPSARAEPAHDGQHDFDWIFGTWKATLKRLEHPLSGSKTWIEYEGTQISRSVWGGRGVMDDFKVDDAKTNTHINGFTLRLYNPDSHQWHIYWANAKRGSLDWPPVIGTFKNGRGEFYDQEVFEGHAIFVRYVWSDITPTSAHFEQSFSADGGRTWEANWISDITRVKE